MIRKHKKGNAGDKKEKKNEGDKKNKPGNEGDKKDGSVLPKKKEFIEKTWNSLKRHDVYIVKIQVIRRNKKMNERDEKG